MAVLVEAISVIIRRDAINQRFAGGWEAFVDCVPNATLCYDEDLARVGFMAPADVQAFIHRLEVRGLRFLDRHNQAVNIAVADQQRGLMVDCDWLEFAQLNFMDLGKVGACWLFEGPRLAHGVHLPGGSLTLATPPGWEYENSLSKEFSFVPDGIEASRLEYLRTEDGVDVYWDNEEEKEVFLGRTEHGRGVT